jgi:NodT family efflux transporter outer membrane factor (OMF) lipoprotein
MMRRTIPSFRPLAVAVAILASGCTLGPEYQRPQTAAQDAEVFAHSSAVEPVTESSSLDPGLLKPWWRRFGDPTTTALVEQALAANTDLKAAAARVLETQALVRQAKGRQLPLVSAGLSSSRQKNSFVLPQVGRVNTTSTTYSDSLSVSYQTDLFGGLRRGKQAAWADLLAREAARETVAHTVVSEVVRSRVRLATLWQAVEVTRAIRESWAETTRLIEGRHRRGLVSTLELRLTRENLASAEAQVVDRERRLAQARLGLDVLLGQRPGMGHVPAAGLEPLPDLTPIPLGLPAELLERRPDLRQAESRLAAATARIGVAMADLFPGLTLSGSTGHSSDVLSDLLSSETLIFNLLANLVATVFDGGQHRAAVSAARARAEEAAADYAGAVLQALREVEDSLLREASWRRQLVFLESRAEEARAADRIARARYQRGVEELRDVLETERRLRSAEEALIDARSALWDSRIDLHLALGGDWQLASTSTAVPAPQLVVQELDESSDSFSSNPKTSREDT